MSTQTFQVEGMTCSHCVAAVSAELTALVPNSTVDIALGTDAPSTVTITGATPLAADQIVAALDEAGGYTLLDGSLH